MLLCPKWLTTWLTPEEEDRLRDPSRRVFTFGLMATAASLALPKFPEPIKFLDSRLWGIPYHQDAIGGPWFGLERVSSREMRIPLQIRPGGLFPGAIILDPTMPMDRIDMLTPAGRRALVKGLQ